MQPAIHEQQPMQQIWMNSHAYECMHACRHAAMFEDAAMLAVLHREVHHVNLFPFSHSPAASAATATAAAAGRAVAAAAASAAATGATTDWAAAPRQIASHTCHCKLAQRRH